MTEFESFRTSFNEVANLYDEVRPGYQDLVIENIIHSAELPENGRILEIGCGTGQMTTPFAVRGYDVLALEPGDALAARAREKCQAYPNVSIQEIAFEEWTVQVDSFDIVLSAQAFHWIEPNYGCDKVAKALHSGGTIALVWNNDISQDTPFYKATQAVYDTYMSREESVDPTRAAIREALTSSGAFNEIREDRYPWEKTYSCSDYLKLLNTYSDHQCLPEPSKTRFFQAIKDVIDREGGKVTRKFETQTLLAHRI